MISAWRGDYPVLDTPLATARILNRARPEQTAELPLVDYWTVFDAQPPVSSRERDTPKPTLTLPARRRNGAHTNLVVANIAGDSLFVRIDFVDATGAVVRTMSPRGALHTGQTELFVNVLGTGAARDFDRLDPDHAAVPERPFLGYARKRTAPTGGWSSWLPTPGMSLDNANPSRRCPMKRIACLLVLFAAAVAARPVLAEDDVLIVAGGRVRGPVEYRVRDRQRRDRTDRRGTFDRGPSPRRAVPSQLHDAVVRRCPGAGTIRVRASDFIGATLSGPAAGAHPDPERRSASGRARALGELGERVSVRRAAGRAAVLDQEHAGPGLSRRGPRRRLLHEPDPAVPLGRADLGRGRAAGLRPETPRHRRLSDSGPSEAFAAFTLVDVAAHFGVETIQDGQVRVRNLTATGPVWGVLATVGTEGSLRVSTGANP